MTPDVFILILLGALGTLGGGGVGWAIRVQRAQRRYVNQVQTEWVRDGQIIHFGPVRATCFGDRPLGAFRSGVLGALGLTGGNLVFSGMSNNRLDLRVPVADVRLIGLGSVTSWVGKTPTSIRMLSVHYETAEGWQVTSFVTREPVEFGQELGHLCGLVPYDAGKQRHDFGPARATQMIEDIYGEWTEPRDGMLYLVPDRLIFDRRAALALAQVRRIDVIAQRDMNPFAADLLRIEYETAEGETAILGYVVRHAQQWAHAINGHIGVPLNVHSGRKKK